MKDTFQITLKNNKKAILSTLITLTRKELAIVKISIDEKIIYEYAKNNIDYCYFEKKLNEDTKENELILILERYKGFRKKDLFNTYGEIFDYDENTEMLYLKIENRELLEFYLIN